MTITALSYSEGWLLSMCVTDKYFGNPFLRTTQNSWHMGSFVGEMLYILEHPPSIYISYASLSLLSPLIEPLFIKPYLHKPKYDKETWKESQPQLFQTMIEPYPDHPWKWCCSPGVPGAVCDWAFAPWVLFTSLWRSLSQPPRGKGQFGPHSLRARIGLSPNRNTPAPLSGWQSPVFTDTESCGEHKLRNPLS